MRVVYIDHEIHVRRWRIVLGTAPGVGNSRTFTLRRAGIDTAATVTISDTATTAVIPGLYLLLTAGNYLTIRATLSGTPAASAVNVVMEYSV